MALRSKSTKLDHYKCLAILALLGSMVAFASAAPIVIAPTTNFSTGTLNNGLYGSIYNFHSAAPVVGDPYYSVSNILNNGTNPAGAFNPVLVGSYVANTSAGINYGAVDSADNQLLTTWLGADGATVHLLSGLPDTSEVLDAATKTGTLLQLTGYIRVTPAMVGVTQTFTLRLDDGGALTINGTPVIDNESIHGAALITQTALFSRAGVYPITIGYYDGDATQAVLEATFGGGLIVSTLDGAALPTIALDPTSTIIQNYVTQVAAGLPTDPTFNNASIALGNLVAAGDAADYENALKELSPLKYAALDSQTVGAVDFITNDLDDYLSHRRTDVGTFRPGNGIDLSGLSVFDGNTDPALQDIAGHLLAFNGNDADPKTMSDSPNSLMTVSSGSNLEQHWNFFTRGIVVISQNFSGGGLQHSDATSGTLQFGGDYQITPHLLAGVFFGYGRSSESLDEEGSTASANSYTPGLYASYTNNGWYGNALAAGGVSDFDVNRNIVFPGFFASTQANPTGEEEYGYISGGKDFHVQNWTFGPTGGVQYVHMNTDAFTENGAGLLDLAVNAHDNDSLRSRLGGRIYYAASDGNETWRPFLDAAWQHEFMENSNSFSAGFNGAGAGTFTVESPGNSRDSALISIGTDIDVDKDTDVFTAYRVEAGSSNFFAQSVEAGVKITF